MVTIDNDGFVFGGNDGNGYNKEVFKISCANKICQWSTTDKVLDNGRYDAVAIPISFNQCISSCPDQQLINLEGKQCVSQCNTDENQLINLEGDQCVSECSNEVVINLAGDQCVASCPDDQIINLEGKQCVWQCNMEENQLINSEGDQCVSECSNGEVINLVGDQCVTSCPVGSSPDSFNPSQCQCPSDELISVMGDQCLVDCSEDQLGNPTFNVDGEQCETSKCFLIKYF